MKRITNEIPNEISMPVYYQMLDANGDIDDENGTPVFDFEEMANELENRICNTLNRNVLITLSELEEEE